jgi:hypothetical protein
MLRSGEQSLARQLMLVISAKGVEQPWQITRSEKIIYLRNFFSEFRLVALRQASGDNEFINRSFSSLFGEMKNGFNGFLLRIIYKSSGIDDDDIC